MRSDARGKSPRVRETVRQDDVREYAVTYDDELMWCEAGEGSEGSAGAGVGGLERSMEQNGRAQVMGDGFCLQLTRRPGQMFCVK